VTAVRAVLFDFNGVLLDDERFHWLAFREILRPYGIPLTRARYDARYLVFDDRSALEAMLRDARLRGVPFESLLRRKRRTCARLARRVRVHPRAARLVRAVARRVPIAVVSGARRSEVVHSLGRAGLKRLFGAIVTAEDVRRPKPWPDGYRLALRRLGLRGGRSCVAIEDSPGGVRAARAAGLGVVAVATSFPAAVLRRAGAGRVVPALQALSLEELVGGERRKPRGPGGSRKRPTRRRS
jgi:HAD superfamily hydrolase (TIGR01509 family)